MSEQKLISPLLDGFVMGDPMSSHNGVRCCPAMRENSDDKYIVKIISVPASQRQLDALLLTGAYKDAAEAADYFKELADGVVKESQLLQKLSKYEGFLSYEGWQIVPMEDNQLGYDVYLVGSYKRSLEKHLRRNTMTHLGAVNLGLDICAALALCRRAGFIYSDLKPANIFITAQRGYRIGDLGFMKLNTMKYTSLPSKYCSCYTPPEMHDPMSTLNPTVDTYALGLILYQIYNNGTLPFTEKATLRELPPPMNADYEMAEIILKAVNPNPRKRWQNPGEMGQALVSYMQRNVVNDTPIVPPAGTYVPPVEEPAVEEEPAPVEQVVEVEAVPSVSEEVTELPIVEEEYVPSEEPELSVEEFSLEELTAAIEKEMAEDALAEEEVEASEPELSEEVENEDDIDEDDARFSMDFGGEFAFLNRSGFDETEPDGDNGADLTDTEMSDEVTSILAQADELMTPEADALDTLVIPTEIGTDSIADDDVNLDNMLPDEEQQTPAPAPTDADDDDDDDEYDDFFEEDRPRKKGRGWIGAIVAILILALLGFGGYYYYSNYYLLPIDDMNIHVDNDVLTVLVTTDVDESKLTVVCTDTYGNTKQTALISGTAVFEDLSPDTQYKINVEAEGFHQLTGSYFGSTSTGKQTNILDFTAKAGTEDGSVLLNFTVDGPETQDWIIEYVAEGEEPQSVSFTGHMVAINNLTVGSTYTFKLVPPPSSELWLVGTNTLEFGASMIVIAEDLSIVSCQDGVLTAKWNVPADVTVESWVVRCYSESGYDQTITVTEPTAQFSDISAEYAYTVEVTAAGMTQNSRTYITSNPTTVSDIVVEADEESALNVSWTSTSIPEGGWLIMYRVDGHEAPDVVKSDANSAVITRTIPNCAYSLTIQAADGSTVFGGSAEYSTPAAESFNNHKLTAADIQASLCPTPDKEDWTYSDIPEDTYTTSYAPGKKISLVLYTGQKFYTGDKHNTVIMYVIRDAEGNALSNLMRTDEKAWNTMWNNKYCYLDIPALPEAPGEYNVEVYFNNTLAVTKSFTITA